MASARSRQSWRVAGSRSWIGRGANAGSNSRRAKAWNGGSDVMGGAPPTGAGSSGRSSDTTTPWLEKCSVS